MNIEAMSRWLSNTLLPYGGFGLMVLAMCDSSFVSLPEVNDVLLMTFAINEPESMFKKTIVIPPALRLLPVKDATSAEVFRDLLEQSGKIQTLTASVFFDTTT